MRLKHIEKFSMVKPLAFGIIKAKIFLGYRPPFSLG